MHGSGAGAQHGEPKVVRREAEAQLNAMTRPTRRGKYESNFLIGCNGKIVEQSIPTFH